ncbi:MAG: iron-sulfur cluster assembly scaffold protein [Pseudomonadota bacterium]
MSAGRGLYTPEMLGAAMELTAYPWNDALPLKGSARSRSCGSAIEMALLLDDAGAIVTLAIKPHACAVGQAAAARFAASAAGRNAAQITTARAELAEWLGGSDQKPDWPGIELLEPARVYPARHGAILLAWDAAIAAME